MEDQKKFIDIHNLASYIKLNNPQALSDIEVILLAVWVCDTLGKGKQVLSFLPQPALDPVGHPTGAHIPKSKPYYMKALLLANRSRACICCYACAWARSRPLAGIRV